MRHLIVTKAIVTRALIVSPPSPPLASRLTNMGDKQEILLIKYAWDPPLVILLYYSSTKLIDCVEFEIPCVSTLAAIYETRM